MNNVWLWRELTSGFAIVAAFDGEGAADADGTVLVAVAVPGADHEAPNDLCARLNTTQTANLSEVSQVPDFGDACYYS
ncbi:hypothetical protein [Streptomyces sp. x-80]|jgi:hypothetical protein|uniref:hypothetical protein n=1 Tax=Streptomyces sp. x-80 TaxID=2789282 RepID=UPI00397FF835